MSKSAFIKFSINTFLHTQTKLVFCFVPMLHSAAHLSSGRVFSGRFEMFLIGKNNDLLFLILEDGI